MKRYAHISLVAVAAIGITGCSVKTDRLSVDEIDQSLHKDLAYFAKTQAPVMAPITLKEAITRAVTYNYDYKVKMVEAAYEKAEFKVTKDGMLPQLNLGAALTNRDNTLYSRSEDLYGNQSLVYSTSNDDTLRTADAKITWSSLDFGLSYVRAKQQSDKYLIALERGKKVENQIVQDVREAYWRAVSAQNLLARIEPVMREVQQTIEETRELEASKTGSMMDALSTRREMLDILLSLQGLKKILLDAKPRLAVLMGLTPGTEFTLSEKIDAKYIKKHRLSIAQMEELAFAHRPELMESRYQKRISLQETKAAMLSVFPGITFDAGPNYTSNSYTYHNSWMDYGARVNMNLIKAFNYDHLKNRAEIQKEIAKEQHKAVCMAVLSQVHLAQIRYQEALEGWHTADDYFVVTKRINDINQQANQNMIISKQKVARDKLSKLVANVKRDMAFAELQNSYGNLYFTMGMEQENLKGAVKAPKPVATPVPTEPKKQADDNKVVSTQAVSFEAVALENAPAYQEGKVAAQIAKGDMVQVSEIAQTQKGDVWYKVSQGYVSATQFDERIIEQPQEVAAAVVAPQPEAEKVAAKVEEVSPSTPSHGIFKAASIKGAVVRDTPHAHGKNIGMIGKGESVEVLEVIPGYKGMSWYKIDGGYVYAALFKK